MTPDTPVTNPFPPLINVTAATAAEVCGRVYLDKNVLKWLRPAMDPREFIDTLTRKHEFMAAFDFLAHALPPRAAIWWGCLCLEHILGDKLEPWEKGAGRAAVRWVLDPNEQNRAAAQRPAEVLGLSSPAGALAAAANQTGGSLGPPNVPPIPPSPFAPARAVAIAIKVVSTKGDPQRIQPTQRSLVDLGMAIAEGRFLPKALA